MPAHKCENCGLVICWQGRKQRKRVKGWIGTGDKSRYGKEFDKRQGYAWWCPSLQCQEAKEKLGLEKLFPGMPKAARETLLKEETNGR